MSSLTVYQDNYDDATIVSNFFIDEYMKDANDAQLKVYIYLLRMVSARKETSISDMADKFNHTEKDVLRALKYWEKNRLLALEYDEVKNLTGIHLKNIVPHAADVISITPVLNPREIVLPPTAAKPEAPPEIFGIEKPSYTLDQLRAFKDAEETSQLLFVVEQYLGKTLSPSEIKTILFISDQLHFSVDLVDYLIQYCVERGKKSFRYIEKVALNWAEEGITTPEQAAKATPKYDKIVYDVMKALGKSNTPTDMEVSYILNWTRKLGFNVDIINEACKRTVMATEKHRFEYANSILVSWHANNVHHKTDINQADEAFAKTKTAVPAKVLTANKFNQFKQNDYDFEALEKELLSN